MVSPALNAPPVRSGSRSVRGLLFWVAAILGLVALTILYSRVSAPFLLNSDYASVPLMADAMVHGNVLLRGWTVVADSLYTTEVPLYAAFIRLRGLTPGLSHFVPALLYAWVVLCVVRLAMGSRRGAQAAAKGAAAFVLVGLPAGPAAWQVLLPATHVGTYLAALAALVCLDAPDGHLSRGRLWGFALLSTAAVTGDAYALWILVLPVVVVCAGRWLAARKRSAGAPEKTGQQTEVVVAVLAVISVVAAKGLLRVVHALGGFDLVPFTARFVPLNEFGSHVTLTVGGLLELFQANFFGLSPSSKAGLLALACLPGVLLTAASLWHVRWPGQGVSRTAVEDGWNDRIAQVLAAGVLTVVLAYMFSTAAIGEATIRYLVPCLLWGAALSGRVGAAWVLRRAGKRTLAALVALIGLAHLGFYVRAVRPPADTTYPPVGVLADWLSARGLTDGYGDYWSANVTTLHTQGHIRIRAVQGSTGRIAPFHFVSDKSWYRQHPARFLVLGPLTAQLKQNLTMQTAVRTFGPPAQTVQVGPDTVLVWDKDIAPALQQ